MVHRKAISAYDIPLIKTFLFRESIDFRWVDGIHGDKATEYRRKMEIEIEKISSESEPTDYIRIQSITNMGLVERELILTNSNWKSGKTLYLLLPPSPKGRVGHYIK